MSGTWVKDQILAETRGRDQYIYFSLFDSILIHSHFTKEETEAWKDYNIDSRPLVAKPRFEPRSSGNRICVCNCHMLTALKCQFVTLSWGWGLL